MEASLKISIMNMVKIAFFSIINISLIQCNGQGRFQKIDKYTTMDSIINTKDFEKFDLKRFLKLKKEDPEVATEKSATGTYVEMQKFETGCTYSETKPHAYFSLLKSYYANGNIEAKGAYFNVPWGGFRKGIWYEFDEKGKLIKEINYDLDYKFTFENVVDYCNKEKIPLTTGPVLQSTGYHTNILREKATTTGNGTWIIRWLKKNDIIEKIILDGNSGTVIEKKETKYINN